MSETTHLPDVNRVHFSAPFAWLLMGWQDFKAEPLTFAAYGAGLALISLGLAGMLYFTGQLAWFLVLIGGFMMIAPISASGLFRAAEILETGNRPQLIDMLRQFRQIRSDQIMLGVALLFLFGLWFEVAYLIYGLSTSAVHRTIFDFLEFMLLTPEGRQMALLGTIVGGVIAFLAYAIVVISAPMLLNQEMDFFIALITSVRTVIVNFPAMLLWAFLIVFLTLIGIATAFLGLVIIFPWIGLSSWHAYRSLVVPQEA
ncbi:MAG: DUF2189 domain-containing protein [Henriciella sp.]|nr:DUF2189 domain-containing protein [Henriciella sp.]